MPNSVQSVTVQINGKTITLDTADGNTFTKTMIAPDASSSGLTGGYYPVTVQATYATGTVTTVDDSDPSLGQSCRLVVKETYKPTIQIVRPANNAYLKNASQTMEFTILDNANGQASGFSGVDTSTLSVTIASAKLRKSTTYGWTELSSCATAITGGYRVVATDTFADSDDWAITVGVSDHDGNAAAPASVTYTIDTVAPELSLTAPIDNFMTSNSSIAISGSTDDAGAGAVSVNVSVDGVDYGSIQVAQDGSFSGTITLSSTGTKQIAVTASDAAGNTTSVTRSVYFSTDVPVIKSVSLVPNPVDNGQTYIVTVVVE